MPAPTCEPDCVCGKHRRTPKHNSRIAIGIQLHWDAVGRSLAPNAIRGRKSYRRRKALAR